MKILVIKLMLVFTSLSLFAQTYSWSELGAGSNPINPNGSFNSICSDTTGNIYTAGNLVDGNGYYYVEKWDGSSWSELGIGSNALNANNVINSICLDTPGNVYEQDYLVILIIIGMLLSIPVVPLVLPVR